MWFQVAELWKALSIGLVCQRMNCACLDTELGELGTGLIGHGLVEGQIEDSRVLMGFGEPLQRECFPAACIGAHKEDFVHLGMNDGALFFCDAHFGAVCFRPCERLGL